MNRILGTYEQGRVIVDSPANWPDGSRVEVSLVSPAPQTDNVGDAPPSGVRKEFLEAMNDPNRSGLEDSLWPETPQERDIWLKWFDSRDRLELSSEELKRMEAFWTASKAEQKVGGIEHSDNPARQRRKLRHGLRGITIWPFDEAAAWEYGRIYSELRRHGRPMQQIDIQIAAIALSLGDCILVTKDSDLSAVRV